MIEVEYLMVEYRKIRPQVLASLMRTAVLQDDMVGSTPSTPKQLATAALALESALFGAIRDYPNPVL